MALAAAACTRSSGTDASAGLVFVRRVNGSNEIARARLSDRAVLPVTHTREREESWPYWSGRAGLLVFQIGLAGREADLVLYDPASGAERLLAATPGVEKRWPAWSPTDPLLVFAFRSGAQAGLALADAAGGTPRPIATSARDDFFFRPSFAPDGTRLVAQRRGVAGRGSHLWIVAEGTPPRRLTSDPEWFDTKPSFTRDGARIVFSRRPVAGGGGHVASIRPDGGDLRVVVDDSAADDHSARPSPTRDEIAFVSDRHGKPEVFVARLDGGDVRKLTSDPGRSDFAPRWSPDGNRIAVVATVAGSPEPTLRDAEAFSSTRVAVLDREGHTLLDVPGVMPDWMPPWR